MTMMTKHKSINNLIAAVFLTAAMTACGGDDAPNSQDPTPTTQDPTPTTQDPTPTTQTGYDELYRPQIHYTPAKNWVNDPNGLVYADGVWHLFYQYNPQGNSWGNMSWGHATSADLLHWQEQTVALTRDELGDIFSGSAVIDRNNTAGFGAGTMVALYTSASQAQQQSLAYSTDGGKTFTRYNGNPVISNNDDNLRDPKVFWHEASQRWVMALAKGWKMGVEFYGSTNLKQWQHLSTFFLPLTGRPSLQWECPDLIQMGDKWVLLVSVNPGGPILGSGTMYFVGQFDGTTFTADELDYPLWLDYGMDNYAGVTWSNVPDGRHILIGWMNNWQYAGDVPCSPWRSAFTLPRELKLTTFEGKPLVTSTVVKEIDQIASSWQAAGDVLAVKDAYQLRLNIGLDRDATITLSNDQDEKFVVTINAAARTASVRRTAATGRTNFNGTFSVPSMQAPLSVEGDHVVLDFFVDQSSVELFTQEGTMSMTNLVFPQSLYNQLHVEGNVIEAQVRSLKSIWKQ